MQYSCRWKISQFSTDSAGLNPAWWNVVMQTMCGILWEDSASSTEGMISQLKGWIKAMYDITPNDGAYFNEVRPARLTWGSDMYAHLPRSTGVLIRDQLARDLFRLALFNS